MLTCKEIDDAIAYFEQMLTEERTLKEIAHEVLTPEAYEVYKDVVMAGLTEDQAHTRTARIALRVTRLVVEQLMEEGIDNAEESTTAHL